MRDLLVYSTSTIFAALSAIHVYWALGGRIGKLAAVPSTGGIAHFSPSKIGTFLVAIALLAAAAVVGITGGLGYSASPTGASIAALCLAVILVGRAVGDFRHVGFCKRHHDSKFARLDTFFYSPLCMALSASIALIVLSS